jgi:glycosyltransferase involved in cell wall biosynthesis
MKIGIDIRALGKKRTGDEVYTYHLVEGLAQLDQKNSYFLFTDDLGTKNLPLLKSLPTNFRVITLLPKSKYIWTFFLLSSAAKKYDLDVLHVQYITPLVLPLKTKLVTTIHDISWKFVPEDIKEKDLFFLNTLIPWAVRGADRIITVSKHSKQAIEEIFPASKGKVVSIYNGGYLDDVPKVNKQNFILYVGSLQPRKNVPFLIECYKKFLDKYQDELGEQTPNLVIAGGKGHNYDERIDEKILEYKLKDKVELKGYVEDENKNRLLAEAKLFVFLSKYEGFGIPAIEAMSMGTPVIVADQSCLPEVVGDAGVVVEIQDSQQVADKMYEILDDEKMYRQLKEKGKKRAKDFQWQKMAKETLLVYKDIITNNNTN